MTQSLSQLTAWILQLLGPSASSCREPLPYYICSLGFFFFDFFFQILGAVVAAQELSWLVRQPHHVPSSDMDHEVICCSYLNS